MNLFIFCTGTFFIPLTLLAQDQVDRHVAEPAAWTEAAPGIWTYAFGKVDDSIRYTALAGSTSRLDVLRKKSAQEFPLAGSPPVFTQTPDGKIAVRISVDPNERFHGYGMQLDTLEAHSGRIMELKVDHWSKGGGKTHAPVPFVLSSKGYGVFFNCARYLTVHQRCGNRADSPNNPPPVDRNPPPGMKVAPWSSRPASDAIEAHATTPGMEIVIFAGDNAQDIVSRYNLYSGGGALPPLWGLGFWTRAHAHSTAAQCRAEVAAYVKHAMPMDVLGLEPGWMTYSYPCTYEWQKVRFPDPGKFVGSMRDEFGVHVNLWENPYISPEGKLHAPMLPLSGSHMVWLGIVPDYTLPEARKLLTDQHAAEHLSIGVSGYKIDEVDGYDHWLWPDHTVFPSGTSAETMRQSYGLLMQRMVYEDLFRKRNVRTMGQVRASNGAASRLPFALYSDSYSYDQYITGLSTASLCGILWGPEIRSAGSPDEWLARMQLTCFGHLAQLNAWASGTKPWDFPPVTDEVREVIQLRMRLLPYLYTAFAHYQQTGVPPIRAMLLEESFKARSIAEATRKGKLDGEKNPYAEIKVKVQDFSDQFMFGPDLLVAPWRLERGKLAPRVVMLPEGEWFDFHTGKAVGNGRPIKITPKEYGRHIPIFVRNGAVIPTLAKDIRCTRDAKGAGLALLHFGNRSGSTLLYEDDTTSFAYEEGDFRMHLITVMKKAGDWTSEWTTVHDQAPAFYGPVQAVIHRGTE